MNTWIVLKYVTSTLLLCTLVRSQSLVRVLSHKDAIQEASLVTCPDGKSTCPDKFTCCPGKSSTWVCCAFYKGSCCTDGVHCCPRSTHCDEKDHRCVAIYSFLELVEPNPSHNDAVKRMSQAAQINPQILDYAKESDSFKEMQGLNEDKDVEFSVECPNHRSFCPNNYTCCRTPDSEYACCEFRHGTCCPDGSHCCPRGFQCDEKSHHCVVKGYPFISVQPIATRPQEYPSLSNGEKYAEKLVIDERPRDGVVDSGAVVSTTNISVECPDRRLFCPDNYTCCHTASAPSSWGCCPYKRAVCCSDGKRCCPENYACDLVNNACLKKEQILPTDLSPAQEHI